MPIIHLLATALLLAAAAAPQEVPRAAVATTDPRAADWWAYRPLLPSRVPAVADPAWALHPLDAFVHAHRQQAGLAPAPPATAAVLVRRATFSLTGLPPTPAEVDAFVAASARDGEGAFAALVDRLLASPHFAECQARHWLDLVRYADTNGYERDAGKPNIWRYRDWVIRAFERDLPYDQFVVQQLAGDELAAAEGLEPVAAEAALLATGFFRLGVWDDEPSDRQQARADELADIVDTTAQVFLATTMGCARCHDHKKDPITQRDYYALTAAFDNLRGYDGGQTQDVGDRPGPDQITAAERDARIAAVDGDLAPVLATLRTAVLGEQPAAAAVLVADARSGSAASWRYQEADVPDGWQTPACDDGAWRQGRGGFGSKGTPGAIVATEWRGDRIFLRTRFAVTAVAAALVLSVHHDEDVAVFLNGVQVFAAAGFRSDYTEVQLPAAAAAALVVGSNVLAVSCRQTGGGQYIDVGLRTGWLGDGDEVWRQRLHADGARHLSAADVALGERLLEQRRALLQAPVAAPYPALFASEFGVHAPVQHVLLRGNAHAEGDVVSAAVPAVFRAGSGDLAPVALPAGVPSTGRRLALARWLVGDGRCLTARAAANRVWQALFGRGLCRSPGDFGRLGELPTDVELLDHLAGELIARGWSIKQLIRYVMTSRTFRMASVGDAAALLADPRNDHYWRFDPRRLTAEEYRDAVLAVSGELRPGRFGPGVFPPLPAEVLATASRPDQAWHTSGPEDANRRSVYVFVKRSLRLPLLEGLDQPDPDMPCPCRFPTNVPTQALMSMNGTFANEMAGHFAASLQRDAADLPARIGLGIRRALGRAPLPGEVERQCAFVQAVITAPGVDASAGLRLFALSLFNQNEFLWID